MAAFSVLVDKLNFTYNLQFSRLILGRYNLTNYFYFYSVCKYCYIGIKNKGKNININ